MNAWNRNSPSSWQFELLEQTSKDELLKREKYFVLKYNACEHGYNLTPDGFGRKPASKRKSIKQNKKKKGNAIGEQVRNVFIGIALIALAIFWIFFKN